MGSLRSATITAVLIPASYATLTAQIRADITVRTDTCQCSIVLREEVLLSDSRTAAYFDDYMMISVDARGRYYTTGQAAPYQIAVFNTDGTLARIIGRQGSGPGEFRRVLSPFFAANGNVHVLDLGNLRHSVYSSDHELLRDYVLPPVVPQDVSVLAGDTLLISGVLRTPASAGFPMHIVAGREVVRSYGPVASTYRVDQSVRLGRLLLTDTSSNQLLAVTRNAEEGLYHIEILDDSGVPRTIWTRRQPDLSTGSDASGSIAQVPPRPRATGAWLDSRGLLWILISAADIEYKPLAGSGEGHVVLSGDDRHRIWDAIVEVVDPARGTLLATQRFRENLYPVRGNEVLFHYYAKAANGEPTFQIVRPWLDINKENSW